MYSVHSHSAADSCVIKNRVEIYNMIRTSNDIVGGELVELKSHDLFYNFAYDSNLLNIFILRHKSEDLMTFCSTDIISKCLEFPLNSFERVSCYIKYT